MCYDTNDLPKGFQVGGTQQGRFKWGALTFNRSDDLGEK